MTIGVLSGNLSSTQIEISHFGATAKLDKCWITKERCKVGSVFISYMKFVFGQNVNAICISDARK